MRGTGGKQSGPFSPAVVVAVVLVGFVSLLGILAVGAFAPDLRSGNDGGEHALSQSATGFGALPILLRDMGVPVILSRTRLIADADDSLLIATPGPVADPSELEQLDRGNATLIVLPKWGVVPDSRRDGWTRVAAPLPLQQALGVLPASLEYQTRLASETAPRRVQLMTAYGDEVGVPVEVEGLRTLSGPSWIPVVVDERGGIVLGRHETTGEYVLADPDLLATSGLATIEGAQTALALIDSVRPEGGPVVFDLTLHGMERSRSLMRLMFVPPLLGFTLALLGLAVFAGVQAAVRFSPPKEGGRLLSFGKTALADNTAGLVRLARREHHMALPYARLVRARTARLIGAPRNLSEAELDAFLDRVSAAVGSTTTCTALTERARNARNTRDLMQVARDLYRWNQELTRGRK